MKPIEILFCVAVTLVILLFAEVIKQETVIKKYETVNDPRINPWACT